VEANRSLLLASVLFVVLAVCGALYLQRGGSSASPTSDPSGTLRVSGASTPTGRYLARVETINAAEQKAWLAASDAFDNLNSSAYDESWITANTTATDGTPTVGSAVRKLTSLTAPKAFRHAQALLLRKYQTQLTMIGLMQSVSAKRDPYKILSLIGPMGRAGDENKALTPKIKAAMQAAASAAGVPLPSWVAAIQ
jgi:hypothetical protein